MDHWGILRRRNTASVIEMDDCNSSRHATVSDIYSCINVTPARWIALAHCWALECLKRSVICFHLSSYVTRPILIQSRVKQIKMRIRRNWQQSKRARLIGRINVIKYKIAYNEERCRKNKRDTQWEQRSVVCSKATQQRRQSVKRSGYRRILLIHAFAEKCHGTGSRPW